MAKKRLPAWLKAVIEDELREYPLTKIAVRERREEILLSTGPKAVVRSSNMPDPTFAKVTRLCSRDLARMEWICRSIEDVFAVLSPEYQEVIRLYYWQRLRQYEVADRLGMSISTLWRIRQDILWSIVRRMFLYRPWWFWGRELCKSQKKRRLTG